MPIKTLDLNYAAYEQNFNYRMGFDTAYHTQNFIYSNLVNGVFVDPPMVQVLTQFLQPGDTFMDIGSHIGYYSLLARQVIGTSGRVFAFEPNPATFSVLVLNSLLNNLGNLHAFNCALADQPGIATLHINQTDEGLSSLHKPADSGTSPAEQKSVMVTAMTLDQLYDLYSFTRVQVVKIDVEGYEWQVIQGGARFFKECAPPFIVFEVNNMDDSRVSDDFVIRNHFHAMGYHAYLIRPWPANADSEEQFRDKAVLPLASDVKLNIGYGNILLSKHVL